MKSVLKTAILLFICSQTVMPVLSADTITIDINIQIQPIEMFIDGSDIPMMKKIAERQWTIQNEKYIRENYLQLSKNAILEKNYKKAIQYASIGLEYVAPLNNSFGEFYKLIGFAFLKNNDYVQAIKNYNIAINNYKLNDSSIYYERGLARYYIDDLQGALKDFNRAIGLGLKNGDILMNGDKIYDYTKDKTQLTKETQLKYFILPPMIKFGKLALISEKIKKCENEKVLDFYAKCIKSGNKLAESYNNRGVYFLENYQLDNAINDFNEALKINNELHEVYFNLALVYYTKEDYQKAKEFLNIYLKNNIPKEYSIGKYGTSLYKTNKYYEDFIIDTLKANIDIKLGYINNANVIFEKYNIKDFSENPSQYKLSMDLLPLLTGKSYKNFSENKYKKSRNYLYELLTADYKTHADTCKQRGKYYYFVEKDDFDINEKYEVIENAYIFNNLALMEYLMGQKDLAILDIQKAKDISFKDNNIDLYKSIVRTYNFINTNK